MRRAVSLCNGGYVLNGEITLFPLDGPERSLVHTANYFRRYDEPVPLEMIVFGGNGRGGFFGLWPMQDGTTQASKATATARSPLSAHLKRASCAAGPPITS